MTPEQVAARLGIAQHQVADVARHGDGYIVSCRDGSQWLVTAEVARPYVADVDGDAELENVEERTGEVDEHDEEERTTEPAPAPKRRRKAASS